MDVDMVLHLTEAQRRILQRRFEHPLTPADVAMWMNEYALPLVIEIIDRHRWVE